MRLLTHTGKYRFRKIKYYKLAVLISILFYSAIFFSLGGYAVYKFRKDVDQIGYFFDAVKIVEKLSRPFRYVVAKYKAKPEHISINIKFKDFQKISYKREVAISNKLLFASSEDYVPAKIHYENSTMKAKLRLKGDLWDHWDTEKWSLRIKIKGANTLFGMKRFSIQHPKTRRYLNEWLILEALRREGVLAVRYKFVSVDINGKSMGIYALEEHFEKRLIEHNRYREGPILKFNEDLMWYEIKYQKSFSNEYGSFSSSNIDGYSKNKVHNSLFEKGVHLLESFRSGDLRTTDVFDSKKLAAFIALMDLCGADELDWNDLRFYYNPVTSKLEPIGFDLSCYFAPVKRLFSYAGGVKYKSETWVEKPHSLVRLIFKDLDFFEQYIKALNRISTQEYLTKLFSDLEQEIESNLNILNSEYPRVKLSKDALSENQKFIRNIISPFKGIHAYHHQSIPGGVVLELGNIQSLPVEIEGVYYKKTLLSRLDHKVVLPPKNPAKPVDYKNVVFIFLKPTSWSEKKLPDLKIKYKILGTDNIQQDAVFPWSHMEKNFLKNDFIRQPSNVSMFDFLIIDEKSKRIIIKPGSWNIKRNLIIPKGYKVICREGTQVNLLDSAKILSYSPVEFIGTHDYPILFQSKNLSGQGIVVMNTKEESVMDHVIFKNLANPSEAGWQLTGAITFYEAPVRITNCEFLDNRSEDALNIVRSAFSIEKSLFSHTQSDALDADFCTGTIKNTSFTHVGDDGIDISGSVVEIENIFIDGTGDKGLSIGENSTMSARHIEIKNAEIGIAAKDLSTANIKDLRLTDSKLGFTVYQKKSEFGPGYINAKKVFIDDVETPHLVEEGSALFVNGKKIDTDMVKVKKVLYGAEYGKRSK